MSGEDAAYELTLDMPNHPKGEGGLVQIPGLGTFENGRTYTISREEADAFRAYHTVQETVYGEDGSVLGSEAKWGPTLLQAGKSMAGVEVKSFNSEEHGDEDPNASSAKHAETTSSDDTSNLIPSEVAKAAKPTEESTGQTPFKKSSKGGEG